MPNTSSSRTFSMTSSSPVTTRDRTFLSQLIMTMAIMICLVGLCPSVSSSPTPSSMDHNNKINYDSDGFMFGRNYFQTAGDSSLVPSPSASSSSNWYVQPRTHANQFLMSHLNDNQIMIPKGYIRFNTDGQANQDGDDELDDYLPLSMLSHKRLSSGTNGASLHFDKRKPLTKAPMEVMNEIVNSIYLKR